MASLASESPHFLLMQRSDLLLQILFPCAEELQQHTPGSSTRLVHAEVAYFSS